MLGGGPAGLYFAILMKQALPGRRHHRARAQPRRRHVRLRRGVFRRDAGDVRALRPGQLSRHHARLRLLGRHRNPLQGHAAPHRRQRVLRLRAAHAAAAAARARPRAGRDLCASSAEFSGIDAVRRCRPDRRRRRHQLRGARGAPRRISAPSVDLRPNRFAWMGSTRPLDAFTFAFRETPHGIFIAHAYQYEPGHSTWVLETRRGHVRPRRARRHGRGGVGAVPGGRVRRGPRRATGC